MHFNKCQFRTYGPFGHMDIDMEIEYKAVFCNCNPFQIIEQKSEVQLYSDQIQVIIFWFVLLFVKNKRY